MFSVTQANCYYKSIVGMLSCVNRLRQVPLNTLARVCIAGFKWKPPRSTKKGINFHRSNQAKQGIFHGKDIRFGHSISHSHAKSLRDWKPNVQNKRLWSDALNDWVRFKITTAGMKAVDYCGGIDNYLMTLDERLVQDSNYVMKMRRIVTASLFHKGELPEKVSTYLRYHVNPPPIEWTQLSKIGDYYYPAGELPPSEQNKKLKQKKITTKASTSK